jgi:hypothetical protein
MSRAVRVRTSHAARTLTSSWRLPQSNIISAGGQARDFSHQNRDIKEQETGVELALKLPQTVPIVNYARGKLRTLFYGSESAATNDICSTLWPTSISMGP